MNFIPYQKFRLINNLGAGVVTLIALVTYWLTAEPGASFWDSPEFIAAGYGLEPNHPPGAPLYALICRFVATFAPSPEYVAHFVNLTSGFFTALTIGLLFHTISWFARKMLHISEDDDVPLPKAITSYGAAAVGTLIFAWSDTLWFSAVEAEVYALSVFITALTVWVMLLWHDTRDEAQASRLLILEAYLIGLSISVHQLNLLVIPALVMIMVYKLNKRVSPLRMIGALIFSLLPIALILFGMMPGMPKIVGETEILAVNRFGLDYGSGVAAYFIILTAVLLTMLVIASRTRSRFFMLVMLCIVAILILTPAAAAVAIVALIASVLILHVSGRRLAEVAWCTAMVVTGFSCYLILPVRGASNPPMNQGAPDNPFSFQAYLDREQYGSHPLFYGHTPYSPYLREERMDSDGNPEYTHLALVKQGPRIFPAVKDATAADRGNLRSENEKREFDRHTKTPDSPSPYYVTAGYRYTAKRAPELNTLFPRIFSTDPSDIESYRSWANMTPESMDSVEISFAVDSAGRNVGRLDPATGVRHKGKALRPTTVHHATFFAGYQLSYMYFRYLLWNFAGRQNDLASQGQIDTGNFITGFPAIDDAMLGPQSLLPERHGEESPGHNAYFLLPLLLGIVGLLAQSAAGKEGVRGLSVVALLFFMTGVAIVIYLNQTPCEPRERDYSFVGSFFAFSIWCGLGVIPVVALMKKILVRILRRNGERALPAAAGVAICMAVPLLMLAQNYDDHDRSGRMVATDWAVNTLRSLDKDAIIFVSGDNFTFPLWYAQEVLGERRDVRVVNTSYLNTSWYPLQLMTQAWDSAPLPFTVTAAQVGYGAFLAVLPPGYCAPADGIATLRELYAHQGDMSPRISSSLLTGDSICVNLGKSITGENLLMADIILTNAARGWKRPIYFSESIKREEMLGLSGNVARQGYVYRLFPNAVDENDDNTSLRLFSEIYSYGGASNPGVYMDEVNGDQIARLRRLMLASARRIASRGDTASARAGAALVGLAIRELPPAAWPFTLYKDRGEVYSEAVDAAEALLTASQITGDARLRTRAFRILLEDIDYSLSFREYYNAIAPGQRAVLTPEFSRRARMWAMPLVKYLEAGGDRRALPLDRLKGIDLSEERKQLNEIIRNGQAAHDSIMSLLAP